MTFRAVVGSNKFFALDADRPLSITETPGGTKLRDGAQVTFTDTKVVELFDEKVGVWFQPPGVGTSSDGNDVEAAHVFGVGMKGIAHNRNIAAAATTVPVDRSNNYASFTAAEAVRELTINAVGSVGGAIANDDVFLVVINAPSAGIAKSWLDDAGAVGQDVQYEIGYVGTPLVIQRTTNILHVDVKPISEVMRFGISAVGVIS